MLSLSKDVRARLIINNNSCHRFLINNYARIICELWGKGRNVMGKFRWPLVTVLAVCVVLPVLAEDIGWQEAVARLAYERTRAETCVKALKAHGKDNEHAIQVGEIAYDKA